jgi:hypothetical protein
MSLFGRDCPCVLAALSFCALTLVGASSCSPSKSPTEPSASQDGPATPGMPPSAPAGPLVQTSETFVGAGDIAVCGSRGTVETANLLDSIPGTVFTTGDNVYPVGSEQHYRDCYEPTWGRHRARTRPSPGNHEYEVPGAAGYFAYFGLNAGSSGLGYYSYRVGAWRIFSLNSNVPADEASAQYQWLSAELAANTTPCALAYWHHPVVTMGPNGESRHMRALWRLVYDRGVDVVLTGHDHGYQRFAPLNGDLQRDAQRGIRQFIVGTGGASLYGFPTANQNAEVRGANWGVLKLTLSPDGYAWEFISIPGEPFRDTGDGVCHA